MNRIKLLQLLKLLLLLMFLTNLSLLYKIYKLNIEQRFYGEVQTLNNEYEIQLKHLLDLNIYKQEIENNFDLLEHFIDEKSIQENEKVILFFFYETFCEVCLERVIKDLENIKNIRVIYAGFFYNRRNYLTFIQHYRLTNELYNINSDQLLASHIDSNNPFIVVHKNGCFGNLFIVDKSFDESYIFYLNSLSNL